MSDDFEVVWRGDLWRDYPSPVIGTLPPDPPLRIMPHGDQTAVILAAFQGVMATSAQIAARTGLARIQVQRALWRLKRRGVLEELRGSGRGRHYRPVGERRAAA